TCAASPSARCRISWCFRTWSSRPTSASGRWPRWRIRVQLRRFKGKALPEVVAQVRAELGPEAVILHTKEGRGFSRFLHGRSVEVVAALDDRRRSEALRDAVPAAAASTPTPRPAWFEPSAPNFHNAPAAPPPPPA